MADSVAQELLDFLNASPTPFHAVRTSLDHLNPIPELVSLVAREWGHCELRRLKYGMDVLDPNWLSHNYEEEIRWMHFHGDGVVMWRIWHWNLALNFWYGIVVLCADDCICVSSALGVLPRFNVSWGFGDCDYDIDVGSKFGVLVCVHCVTKQ